MCISFQAAQKLSLLHKNRLGFRSYWAKPVIRARYWGANIRSRGGHDLDTFKR